MILRGLMILTEEQRKYVARMKCFVISSGVFIKYVPGYATVLFADEAAPAIGRHFPVPDGLQTRG